jgi:hypothetical protein
MTAAINTVELEKKNGCTVLVGKTQGNKPLGRPRSRWLRTEKLVGCFEHNNKSLGSIKYTEFLD